MSYNSTIINPKFNSNPELTRKMSMKIAEDTRVFRQGGGKITKLKSATDINYRAAIFMKEY